MTVPADFARGAFAKAIMARTVRPQVRDGTDVFVLHGVDIRGPVGTLAVVVRSMGAAQEAA